MPAEPQAPIAAQQGVGPIVATEPHAYSDVALTNALLARLTQDELRLIVNPLASNATMSEWAQKMTIGATNDESKAKLLFDVCVKRLTEESVQEPQRGRTATEVLGEFDMPQATFYCQDLAFLYVASARTVGLRAFVADVEEGIDGSKAPHCCAAVFLDGGAFLVDATYLTFGARHKRFKVLDDLQVIGLYLSQFLRVEQSIVASKLATDLVQVQMNLLQAYTATDNWDACRALLPTIQRLDTDGAATNYALALIAISRGEAEPAAELVRKCLTVDPTNLRYHRLLVDAYAQAGKIDAAREACEKAILVSVIPGCTKDFHDLLSHTNKLAARVWENRGMAKEKGGDWITAITLLSEAVKLDPQSGTARVNRGVARQNSGDLDGACDDYVNAVAIDPLVTASVAPRLYLAGCMRYSLGEFRKANETLAKVCEMLPRDDDAHFRLWAAYARMGESARATKELQTYLDARRYGSNVWQSKLGQFLTGRLVEHELFEAAKNSDTDKQAAQQCRSYYYAAVKRLLAGDRAVAIHYLQECLARSATSPIERVSASIEIKRQTEDEVRSTAGDPAAQNPR